MYSRRHTWRSCWFRFCWHTWIYFNIILFLATCRTKKPRKFAFASLIELAMLKLNARDFPVAELRRGLGNISVYWKYNCVLKICLCTENISVYWKYISTENIYLCCRYGPGHTVYYMAYTVHLHSRNEVTLIRLLKVSPLIGFQCQHGGIIRRNWSSGKQNK